MSQTFDSLIPSSDSTATVPEHSSLSQATQKKNKYIKRNTPQDDQKRLKCELSKSVILNHLDADLPNEMDHSYPKVKVKIIPILQPPN